MSRHADFERWERPLGLDLRVFNILALTSCHIFAIYAWFLTLSGKIPLSTLLFDLFYATLGILGTMVGAHRYWSHKSFKANKPLQVILMIMQTISFSYPIYKWCLMHRIHHKYADTDADPHNSQRGLFFSHIGWLLSPQHPEYKNKLETFDMPDLENDPIVRFQSRWYLTLASVFDVAIPIAILYYFWNMPFLYGIAINLRRYVIGVHCLYSINSFAHKFGDKPYDKNICATENPIVSFFAMGEGWHNYHHTFPWDYKASEYGWNINPSTMFIDFFAWIGWATDLKTVSQKMLKERLRKTGDEYYDSHVLDKKSDFDYSTPADVAEFMKNLDHPIWGWEDEKLTEDFRKITKVLKTKSNTSSETCNNE